AFGIDRSFGGVQIFRAGFLVGGEGASGEGDYFCRFGGYREHYAISELGVHCGVFGVAAAGFGFFLTWKGVNFPTLSVHRSDGQGWGTPVSCVFLFPGEEAAFAQDFFAEFVLQTIAEDESGVWGEAYSELL